MLAALLHSAGSAAAAQRVEQANGPVTPLTIGETFTIASKVLGEVRRINVYLPPGYADSSTRRFPVTSPGGTTSSSCATRPACSGCAAR
jgi:hypothetical protein